VTSAAGNTAAQDKGDGAMVNSKRSRMVVRRRTVLAWSAGTAGVLAFGASGVAFAGENGVAPAVGRAAVNVPAVRPVPVEGTGLTVRLLAGPAATVLVYAARRFHYEIDTLRAGELVGTPAGTAIDIRPGWYPPGVTGAFLPHQEIVIRDILAECDGLLRWGGDDKTTPRESRFELTETATHPRTVALAHRLTGTSARPGAETARPFTTSRIRKAATLHKRMTR
jgi:hypothetical protein